MTREKLQNIIEDKYSTESFAEELASYRDLLYANRNRVDDPCAHVRLRVDAIMEDVFVDVGLEDRDDYRCFISVNLIRSSMSMDDLRNVAQELIDGVILAWESN